MKLTKKALITQLRTELLLAQHALAFYADESHYDHPFVFIEGVLCDGNSKIDQDSGKKARAALGFDKEDSETQELVHSVRGEDAKV